MRWYLQQSIYCKFTAEQPVKHRENLFNFDEFITKINQLLAFYSRPPYSWRTCQDYMSTLHTTGMYKRNELLLQVCGRCSCRWKSIHFVRVSLDLREHIDFDPAASLLSVDYSRSLLWAYTVSKSRFLIIITSVFVKIS